jgi:hypothetical protein
MFTKAPKHSREEFAWKIQNKTKFYNRQTFLKSPVESNQNSFQQITNLFKLICLRPTQHVLAQRIHKQRQTYYSKRKEGRKKADLKSNMIC